MDVMEARRKILANTGLFVPPEYDEYEFLQTIGYDARIDTGIAGNDSTLELDFTLKAVDLRSYHIVIGNYVNENTKCFRVLQSVSTVPRVWLFTANKRRAGASTIIYAVSGTTGSIANAKVHFHMTSGRCMTECEDGTTRDITETDDGTTAISTLNLAIGAPSPVFTGLETRVRFYGPFKIWRSGKLVRNYVPVSRKSDSKTGYFDTVNCTFNPSIGTKDFIAGND